MIIIEVLIFEYGPILEKKSDVVFTSEVGGGEYNVLFFWFIWIQLCEYGPMSRPPYTYSWNINIVTNYLMQRIGRVKSIQKFKFLINVKIIRNLIFLLILPILIFFFYELALHIQPKYSKDIRLQNLAWYKFLNQCCYESHIVPDFDFMLGMLNLCWIRMLFIRYKCMQG